MIIKEHDYFFKIGIEYILLLLSHNNYWDNKIFKEDVKFLKSLGYPSTRDEYIKFMKNRKQTPVSPLATNELKA